VIGVALDDPHLRVFCNLESGHAGWLRTCEVDSPFGKLPDEAGRVARGEASGLEVMDHQVERAVEVIVELP